MDKAKFKNLEEFAKEASNRIDVGIKKGMAAIESHMMEKQEGDIDAQFLAFFLKEYKDYAFKASYKATKKFIERCNQDFYEPQKFIEQITKSQKEEAQEFRSKNREKQLLEHITSQEQLHENLREYRQSVITSFQTQFKYDVSLLDADRKELQGYIDDDVKQFQL